MLKPLTNTWELNLNSKEYVNISKRPIQEFIYEVLIDPFQKHLKDRLTSYLTCFSQILIQTLRYQNDYRCLLHGDCSAHNVMFCYKVKFQLSANKLQNKKHFFL